MRKRRSIGKDPLDWVGEPGSPLPAAAADGGEPENGAEPAGPAGENGGSAVMPLPAGPTAYQLERQLLLVDGLLREGSSRPRINRVLLAALALCLLLASGLFLYREARRQWGARVVSLETALDRLDRDRGKEERIYQEILSEKDVLLREKQATIARMAALGESTLEELRLARAESRRLKTDNQRLLERLLSSRDPTPAGPDPAPADSPLAQPEEE